MSLLQTLFFALITGLLITTSQVLSARLAKNMGAIQASILHHFVGFLFILTLFILFKFNYPQREELISIPFPYLIGGCIGIIILSINNLVLPSLGSVRYILGLISGQMVVSGAIDLMLGKVNSLPFQLLGTTLILLGVCLPLTKIGQNTLSQTTTEN